MSRTQNWQLWISRGFDSLIILGFKLLIMKKPSRNANCDQLSSHNRRGIMLLQNELSNEQNPQFVIQDVEKQTVRLHELSLIWTTVSGRIIRPKSQKEYLSPPTLGTRGSFLRAADGRRRAARPTKRVIIQTWPTAETVQGKHLTPRVVTATFVSCFSSK